MKLDFSKLHNMQTQPIAKTTDEKQATSKPVQQQKDNSPIETTYKNKDGSAGLTDGSKWLSALQRQSNVNKEKKEQHLSVEERFRQAEIASRELKAEILQGIPKGENIYIILLKALEALGIATADDFFFRQAEASLLAVYAEGLREPDAVEAKLKKIKARLAKLETAAGRDGLEAGDKQRIATAIKAELQTIARLSETANK